MIFIGAPTYLYRSCTNIINIDILIAAHYLYRTKLDKKLPSYDELKDHISHYREICSMFSRYNRNLKFWNKVSGAFKNL